LISRRDTNNDDVNTEHMTSDRSEESQKGGHITI